MKNMIIVVKNIVPVFGKKSFLKSFKGTSPAVPLVHYDSDSVEEAQTDTLLVSSRDCTLKRIQKELHKECAGEHCSIELIMRPGIDPVMDMLLSVGKKKNKYC